MLAPIKNKTKMPKFRRNRIVYPEIWALRLVWKSRWSLLAPLQTNPGSGAELQVPE